MLKVNNTWWSTLTGSANVMVASANENIDNPLYIYSFLQS